MDISELYQIYQAHPVITTDSRDCPEGSIFLALKAHRLMATSLRHGFGERLCLCDC